MSDEEANRRRRAADRELCDQLARDGFAGPKWDRFAAELVRYGRRVLMAWLRTGEIFRQCQAKGCPTGPAPEHWTEDDREGMVDEVVGVAVVVFREQALIAGKWSEDGGAALTTYFIGTCVYQFPNAFRRWRTDDATWQALRRLEPGSEELASRAHSSDTEEEAIGRLISQDALNAIPDERTRQVLQLRSYGYNNREIAEIMGISVKAVEGLVSRHRKRMAQDGSGATTASRRAP